jgi:CRISPR-associated protein Csx17
MAVEHRILASVAVPGLNPDSLGNYLASLGLLRALARHRWPGLRIAWTGSGLRLVGGPESIDDVLEALLDMASNRRWTQYNRGWNDAQKESTKKKSGRPLAVWQASASESELELFSAHAVPAARVSFNPLLGSGGNAGKRDFSQGWKRAVDALAPGEGLPDSPKKRAELKALLLGHQVVWMLEKLNAACWFSDTNKIYNSGQRSFREGAASPWAMVLACEGLPFFAGGASRRLGSRAHAVGAFPFVTRSAAPVAAGEAGRDRGEIWAPIWNRPMTVPEVAALFSRGRAEVGGRGVLTPGAFVTAVMRRGFDAGITEFKRFVLGRTTSANTFEPRSGGTFHVGMPGDRISAEVRHSQAAAAIAFERLLGLIEKLPADHKVGNRWRFVGLRGDLEAAMLRAAQAPADSSMGRNILDAVVTALDRIDKNKSFRERRVTWEPLPLEWLPTLFADETPSAEARLALALVSSFPADQPFATYRFGTEFVHRRWYLHPPTAPKQWVWRSAGLPTRVLADVLHRRTLDFDEARGETESVRSLLPATSSQVDRWLAKLLDEELLVRWVSRLALFDWRLASQAVRPLAIREDEQPDASGALCLFGLFQPLFDLRALSRSSEPTMNLLPPESNSRTPAAARTLSGFLRIGDIPAAVRFAANRYSMAGVPLVRTRVQWGAESERLTASLLFPIFDQERSALVERWLRPRRSQGDFANA